MAAHQQPGHLALDARNVFRAHGLRVEDAQHIHAGVILHQRMRNNDRLFLNFGKAEGGDALTEDADDGEGQLAHANVAADGIFQPENAIGKVLGNEANFTAGFHVRGIEIAAANNQQAPYGLKSFSDANEIYRTLRAADEDGHGQLARAGDFLHTRNGSFHGIHIPDGELVAKGLALRPGMNQLGPNKIRADAFDLGDDESAAGKGDGDDPNDGGAADDHAQGGENGAQLVAAERVDGHGQRFAQVHHDVASGREASCFFSRFKASRASLLFGSNLTAISYS